MSDSSRYRDYDRFYLGGTRADAERRRRYCRDCEKKYGFLLEGGRERRILDVGCAAGMLVGYLKGKGFAEVVGVDLNESLIEQARTEVEAEFICTDALDFLRSGQRFDIIFLLNVVEHIERDELVVFMTAVCEALQPEGFAVVRTPNMSHVMAASHLADDLTHCTGLTEQSLGQLARRAGFREVAPLNQFRMQNWKGGFKALLSWPLHKWLWWLRGGSRPTVIYRNLYAQLLK